MIKEQFLTNERLQNLFFNNFEMINYAIRLARDHMRAEEPKSLKQIIEELAEMKKEK